MPPVYPILHIHVTISQLYLACAPGTVSGHSPSGMVVRQRFRCAPGVPPCSPAGPTLARDSCQGGAAG